MLKLNLNHFIAVNITEKGFEHLESTVGKDYITFCILPHKINIENEVYYNLQHHQVINLFGNRMYGNLIHPIFYILNH